MIDRRKWTAIPGLIVLAVGAVALSAYSGASSSKNRSPVQPIDFPHPVHVQTLGLNCLYCHYSADRSPDPGLPAVGTCMGCHVTVGPNRPAMGDRPAFESQGIKKLYEFAGRGPGPGAPQIAPARPIPWIRIHKVPEYVRFPHMRHVNVGVTCQACHGQVQKMDRVYQYASLNMGWCVSCHVNGYSESEGLEAAGYAPAAATAPPAAERKKARYDCAVCHY